MKQKLINNDKKEIDQKLFEALYMDLDFVLVL
jgi:hypothetical protein